MKNELNELFFQTSIKEISLLRNKELLNNEEGYFKKKGYPVLTSVKSLIKYSQYSIIDIAILYENEKPLLKGFHYNTITKFITTINVFDENYFSLEGKENKHRRYIYNSYTKSKKVEIYNTIQNPEEFDLFIKKWVAEHSNLKYNLSDSDIHFFNSILFQPNNLTSKYFYIDKELVGYTVFEKIDEYHYNFLFGKALKKHRNLGYFIDFYSIKSIFDNVNDTIYVNFGESEVDSDLHKNKISKYNSAYTYKSSYVKLRKIENNKNKQSMKTEDINVVKVMDINELTPIEIYNNVYFKRDDLYKPFNGEFSELGGSKIRQLQFLIDYIKNTQSNVSGIMTYNQVTSIQSLVVAKIANEHNLDCTIGIGVKSDKLENTIEKYKPLKLAQKLGASIISAGNIGYNSSLQKFSKEYSKTNNQYLINFGLNAENCAYYVLKGVIEQVKNIPDDLDYLIVPCGSGITLAGIIAGCKFFNKKVKNILGIQISGYDRRKDIDNLLAKLNIKKQYRLKIDTTYDYKKSINVKIENTDILLNGIYEAKAYEYFIKNKSELGINQNDKVLFWIIGDNQEFIGKEKNISTNLNSVNISKSVESDIYFTKAYFASLMSKNVEMIGDFEGYQKKDEVVLYNPDLINDYKITAQFKVHQINENQKINLQQKFDIITSTKNNSVISKFTSNYFSLIGSNCRRQRALLKKYSDKIIEIKEKPNSNEEVFTLIDKWKELKKEKYFQFLTGKDKNFIEQYLNNKVFKLKTSFFYENERIIGFSIIEQIDETHYNLLIRKANPEYNQLSFYIDYICFEKIHNSIKQDFYVNLGIDSGSKGIKSYKLEKFPLHCILPIYNLKLKMK
jgi:1-aminocyclopropane-1-carboxylate deaminase/D-cysteine desulfhydrase-like pyridoxal-dependent ACC family enzyme